MLEICMDCGSNEIVETQLFNQGIKWEGFPMVFVNGKIPIKKCKNCGAIKDEQKKGNEEIKTLVETSISDSTRKFIEFIVHDKKINQQDLAKMLGITPIHLSRIKNGDRLPSFIIFNFLKTLYFSIKNGDGSFDFAKINYNYLDEDSEKLKP